jgi:hypothetical protein
MPHVGKLTIAVLTRDTVAGDWSPPDFGLFAVKVPRRVLLSLY